jgi:hypothetical protein
MTGFLSFTPALSDNEEMAAFSLPHVYNDGGLEILTAISNQSVTLLHATFPAQPASLTLRLRRGVLRCAGGA